MRISRSTIPFPALACLLLAQCGADGAGETPKVRPMAVAGTFYPADPKVIEKTIDGFLAQAAAQPPLDAVALVVPHAGWEYAGSVAAYSWASLKGRKIDRVVIVAPSHYEAFGFASVYDGAAYTTPLGQVPVDRAFAAKLASMNKLIRLSGAGHTPSPGKLEHSVEVHLPFLQRVIGQFQLVPIVMGSQDYEVCRAVGVALAKMLQGQPNTLIVASSDLSHYHTYDEAVKMDHKTLKGIEEWDYLSMSRNFDQGIWEACGGGPIIAAMIASERLGASQAKVLKYANSGDVPGGDKSRVVGYGAVAFLKKQNRAAADEPPFSLEASEKQELLNIARQSVETAVQRGKAYEPPPPASEALNQERGAFVTLTERGDLRGCIGYTAPTKPLYLTVRDVARFAALQDPRFHPVAAAELGKLDYEISVLSPMRRVMDAKEIVIGTHGLLIRKGRDQGLLLPQVATEEKWDRAEFLEEVCYKAGLPRGSWQQPDADLFRFTALVFDGAKAR
ncbi:MAG: AmmeMemoRadiSam system protein B [Bryobacteraceae bacterium]|jgi:AmmeMemoRadiSam system protein B/AmmeMemoRadiSam system protein A